jgi:hypothetical protein
MAERFTGFWETAGGEGEVATTVGPIPTEDLLERLRVRLEAAEPGAIIRIDLIAWSG